MPEPSELERVLAALDEMTAPNAPELGSCGDELGNIQDAADLLREMARDFAEYADHGLTDRGENCERAELGGRCGCGLDAARERWRRPVERTAEDIPPSAR